jgi:hypothetical protein
MSVLIIAVGLTVRLGYWILMRGVTRRTQGWIQGGARGRAAGRRPAALETLPPPGTADGV